MRHDPTCLGWDLAHWPVAPTRDGVDLQVGVERGDGGRRRTPTPALEQVKQRSGSGKAEVCVARIENVSPSGGVGCRVGANKQRRGHGKIYRREDMQAGRSTGGKWDELDRGGGGREDENASTCKYVFPLASLVRIPPIPIPSAPHPRPRLRYVACVTVFCLLAVFFRFGDCSLRPCALPQLCLIWIQMAPALRPLPLPLTAAPACMAVLSLQQLLVVTHTQCLVSFLFLFDSCRPSPVCRGCFQNWIPYVSNTLRQADPNHLVRGGTLTSCKVCKRSNQG